MTDIIKTLLDPLFTENGWRVDIHNQEQLLYSKPCDETSSFNIQFFSQYVRVSVPIKHSTYQYSTSFKQSNNVEKEIHNYIMDKLFEYSYFT